MYALGVLGEIVPEHVGILEMRLRVTLLGVDEVWKLGRVADEEYRGVVEHLRREVSGRRDLVVVRHTQSRLPSSVRIFMAKPRGSRALSAEPDSPPTVEKRIVVRALVPTCAR